MVRTVGDDPGDRKLIDDVAVHGWHCVHILEDDEGPAYSFTVGLFHSFGHPELIIFGLPAKVAHQILAIAADAAKAGTPIDLFKPTDELLNDYTCCFAEVPHAQYHEHVGYCRWFYEGDKFPLYQIIWPSRAGLYPWHPDAAAEFKAMQPVIALVPGGGTVLGTGADISMLPRPEAINSDAESHMSHSHHFKSWTFTESVNTGTFTTRPVLDDSRPILDVYHSKDGDWQFLCGTTLDHDDLKLVCLGCGDSGS